MKGKMNMYYDEEGDYLEIFAGEPVENYGEDIAEDITIFKDEKTDEVVGIGILNFKKRATNMHEILSKLPVSIKIESA